MHVEPTFPFGRPEYVQRADPIRINSRAQSEQNFKTEGVHHENLWIVSGIKKKKYINQRKRKMKECLKKNIENVYINFHTQNKIV